MTAMAFECAAAEWEPPPDDTFAKLGFTPNPGPQTLKWPDPCAGPHDPHPHDHGHWVTSGDYAGKRHCEGRFWCARCWRWFDGEACKPGPRVVIPIAAR